MNVAGIDVSYQTLDVVVRQKGKSLPCRQFDNTPVSHGKLLTYLKSHQVSHVVVEATGYYHLDLAKRLDDSGHVKVMVINPRAAKHFANALMVKLKNDAADAKVLSNFAERMEFIPWTAPDADVFALRTCGSRLIAFTKERTQAKNQRHGLTQTKWTPAIIL